MTAEIFLQGLVDPGLRLEGGPGSRFVPDRSAALLHPNKK